MSGAYISLVEAGRLMGYAGKARNVARRALSVIQAKERKIKKPILLPRVGDNGGVRYMVPLWTLKKRMPELFDRRDEMADKFQERLSDIDDSIAEHWGVIKHLGEVVAELEKRLARMGIKP